MKITEIIRLFSAQEFDRMEERFNHEIERMTEKLQNAQYQVNIHQTFYLIFFTIIEKN
jgi:hypothetical protein